MASKRHVLFTWIPKNRVFSASTPPPPANSAFAARWVTLAVPSTMSLATSTTRRPSDCGGFAASLDINDPVATLAFQRYIEVTGQSLFTEKLKPDDLNRWNCGNHLTGTKQYTAMGHSSE
ncbi:hypothetical protein ASPZODRAFT_144802 [Penicilliopsis zonata CBS 506.65]|uniref:Uncharacterized protein n=1 Tax=Penicilliopsis zonata CBS 506.65 TaxID=1073090 RepID=A0A1L9SAU2_9EURO|nr:hypothetical protein ASPZODRAFT_144802 [Penicilliopsis zonata CBS 506.65]OJJ44229.1 hypothetical protein ASPZODRAFT_144802 [Penicilliopsis zonata CBS 506.65]